MSDAEGPHPRSWEIIVGLNGECAMITPADGKAEGSRTNQGGNKMQKKGIALFLVTAMIWAMSVPAWAATNPFSDLESDHWAYDSVVTLAAAGLVEGYPDGTFGGDRNFTRYEMAMVFARILARFEQLIKSRIDDGIDLKSADLEAKIQATRDALESLIAERYNELADAIARLDQQDRGDHPSPPVAPVGMSDDARAALADQVLRDLASRLDGLAAQRDVDELARRIVAIEGNLEDVTASLSTVEGGLQDVEGGLQDLERRMLQLEGSTPTRAEVQLMAEQAVAAALADRDEEVRAALAAARGDSEGLSALIDRKVDELAGHIQALAEEFRSELNALGVRVDALELQVSDHEERIEAVEARLSSLRFFGSIEGRLEHTALSGTGPYLKDPRDPKTREYEAGNEFSNRLTLGVASQPAENVDVKAELVFKDMFGEEMGIVEPGINVLVTTPGVLRSLSLGDIDLIETSAHYNKYTLHRQVFDDAQDEDAHEVRGAEANLVYGLGDSTTVNAFLVRSSDANYVAGAAGRYTLSDAFDLTLRGIHQTTSPEAANIPPVDLERNTTVTLESSGQLASITYSGIAGFNSAVDGGGVETQGRLLDGWAELPLLFATGRVDVAWVGTNYNPLFGKELDSGQVIDVATGRPTLPSYGDDWLERKLAPPEDVVTQGQRDIRASISSPLFGLDTTVAVGNRRDGAGRNDYGQVEISNVDLDGIVLGGLFDVRRNQNDQVDRTVRVSVASTILGADVEATIHNRKNDQTTWTNPGVAPEAEQRAVWVSATNTVNLVVPLALEAHLGSNSVTNQTATRFGVGTEVPFGDLTLRAGVTTEQNAVGSLVDNLAITWWKNNEWTSNQRDSATVGFDYTLRNVFGTDLKTGFEHRRVWVNDALYGTARNTLSASFEKELRGGEAILSASGKLITGGNDDEDPVRNERDLIANVKLTYPVFNGANLTVGGEWVSSQGSLADEYNVFRLDAGMKVEF